MIPIAIILEQISRYKVGELYSYLMHQYSSRGTFKGLPSMVVSESRGIARRLTEGLRMK